MDREIFERNLLALSGQDKELCTRLSRARTDSQHYQFIPAKTGELIPALRDENGQANPLQSIMDPVREARRLLTTVQGPVFLAVFGLAGGDLVSAALEREDITGILIIEFGIDAVAELLASRAYHRILGNRRVTFLVDPTAPDIEKAISTRYLPAFCGGIQVLPIRQRTRCDQGLFNMAGEAIRGTIGRLSRDYSVQAHFGKRWFANTLRNILVANRAISPLPSCRKVIIAAAGPSLEEGYEAMRKRDSSCFLLASDTALQHLLARKIVPDGVISIDCQHISYLHIMEVLPPSTRLFLDLASPHQLATQSNQPFFLTSAHPLSRYIAKYWRAFPQVDSSGGNVTHAAVSLALSLGARDIHIFGADYAYPKGQAYARGTYIHRLFSLSQSRTAPLSAQFFAFIHRDTSARMEKKADSWRISTETLDAYREAILAGFAQAPARIHLGESITGAGENAESIPEARFGPHKLSLSGPGPAKMGQREFLEGYKRQLARLPRPDSLFPEYLASLSENEREVFYTLLPLSAQLRRMHPRDSQHELFDRLIANAMAEVSRILSILDTKAKSCN